MSNAFSSITRSRDKKKVPSERNSMPSAPHPIASHPNEVVLNPANVSIIVARRIHEFLTFLSDTTHDLTAVATGEPVTAQEELQDLFPDTFVAPFYLLFLAAAVNCITNLIFNLASEWREERLYRATLAPPRIAISQKKEHGVSSAADGEGDTSRNRAALPAASSSSDDEGFLERMEKRTLWGRIRGSWRKEDVGDVSERAPLIDEDDSIFANRLGHANVEGSNVRFDYGAQRDSNAELPATSMRRNSKATMGGSNRPDYDEEPLVGVSTQAPIEEAIAEIAGHTRSTHDGDFATSAVDGRAKGLMYSPAYALQRKGKGTATDAEAAQAEASANRGESNSAGLPPRHSEKRSLRRWYHLLMHPNQMFVTFSILKAALLMLTLFYHIDATGGWDRFVILAAANIFGGQLSAVFTLFVCKLLPVHRSVLWSSVFGFSRRGDRRPIRRRRLDRKALAEASKSQLASDDGDSNGPQSDHTNHEHLLLGGPVFEEGHVESSPSTDTETTDSTYNSLEGGTTSDEGEGSESQETWEWENDDGEEYSAGTSHGRNPLNVRFGIYAPGLEDGLEEDVGDDATWSDDSISESRRGSRETVTTPSTPTTVSTPSSETSEESIEEFRARIAPYMAPRRDRNNSMPPIRRRRAPRNKKRSKRHKLTRQPSDEVVDHLDEPAQTRGGGADEKVPPQDDATEATYLVPTTQNMGHVGSEESDSADEDEEEEESVEDDEESSSSEEYSEDEDDDETVLSWRQRQRHQRRSRNRAGSMTTTVLSYRGRARRRQSCLSRCCPAPIAHIIRRAAKYVTRLPRKARKWCSDVASLPEWVSLDYIFLRYDYLNFEDLSYVFTHGTVFITVSSFIVPVFLWFVVPGIVMYFWLLLPIPLLTMMGCRIAYRTLYVLTVRHSRKLRTASALHAASLLYRVRVRLEPSLLIMTSSLVLFASRIALIGIYTWAFQAAMIYAALFLFGWDGMSNPTSRSPLDITLSGCVNGDLCTLSLQHRVRNTSTDRHPKSNDAPFFAGHLRSLTPGSVSDPIGVVVAAHRKADLHTENRYISVVELELRARLVPVHDYIHLVLDGRITDPHDKHNHTRWSQGVSHPDMLYLRKGAVVVGLPLIHPKAGGAGEEAPSSIDEVPVKVVIANTTIPADDVIITPYWMRLTILAGQLFL